ncbi:MAG: phosphate signaling complex protein PhoU [Phycisphaerales bacterium JB059]
MSQSGSQEIGRRVEGRTSFDKELIALRRRIVREASMAFDLLESALRALWTLDEDGARRVRRRDDRVDREEVAIEVECFRLLALQQPFGGDLRQIAFCIKVNQDIERVADHASSIAKLTAKIGNPAPNWPTSLVEMGERVPVMCHNLLRAVLTEDVDSARDIIASDKLVDRLDDRLFDDVLEMLDIEPGRKADVLRIHRIGRELERVGDLMVNIAEDVVFLVTGEIVRHEKKRKRDTLGDANSA